MSKHDTYGNGPDTPLQAALPSTNAATVMPHVCISAEMIEKAVELFDTAGLDTTQHDWESHVQHAPDTHAHQKRVARLAYDLAQFYPEKNSGFPQALDQRDVSILVCAALHHDLGKLRCDGQLVSGGPLPRQLREAFLQPHVLYSFDILKDKDIHFFNDSLTRFNIENNLDVPLLREDDKAAVSDIASVALYHHEKFDGTGYPYQMSGRDIPLASRILAVADVYDAMRHSRSYKDKIKLKDTLQKMHKDSGKHFDPMALDCLIFMKANDDVRATLMPASKGVGAYTSVPAKMVWPTEPASKAPVRKLEHMGDPTPNVAHLILHLG